MSDWKGKKVVVSAGRKFAKGRTGTVTRYKPELTYWYKPYKNGYTDRKTFKVWVMWDDGRGMDMVDVNNLADTALAAAA